MKIQTLANNFHINQQRRNLVEHMTHEYLSIIAILYGDQIEMGVKRVAHFGNMTMLEAENELRIRTMMIRGQRLRKKRDLRTEHEAAEQAMLEQLKRSKG